MKPHRQNKGEKSYKDLIVTTSWDDGSVSDIKLSSLLEKYSLKATFYVTKSYRYLERYLTSGEIIELGNKHEIGAHTLTHPDLDKISTKRAEDEILGSNEYLENVLHREVKMFCYPRERYNDEIIRIVKKAGFIGARTCSHGGFDMPNDPYKWQITLHASNGSPRMTFRIWRINRLSVKSLIDWEIRAKELFDLALERGGVYHLWGHASEFEKKDEWDKLGRVFKYISNREEVRYMTNGEIIDGLTMKRALVVRAYEEGAENELFELEKAVWGEKVPNKERWMEGWKWMYIDNPAGASIIWLAWHDGVLVGQYPLVMETIKIGEEIVMGAQIADTMTHPEYRRQGMAFALGEKALSQLRKEGGSCVIGFPTTQAYKLHMKSGWLDICAFQIMVKPLNLNSILRSYLPSNKFLLKISTGIGSLILKMLISNEKPPKADELIITKISYFDNRFDDFWKKVSNDYNIIVVRNKKYLNWRYVDVPTADYSIYVAERKGEICGYVVLGYYKRGDLMLGCIYDIITPLNQEDVLHCLISKAIDHFKDEKVDCVFYEMVGPKIYRKIFLKNGFIPYFWSKSRFIAYNASYNISQMFLKNPKNWFVQLGDLPRVYQEPSYENRIS